MAMFNSYVKLPEGISLLVWEILLPRLVGFPICVSPSGLRDCSTWWCRPHEKLGPSFRPPQPQSLLLAADWINVILRGFCQTTWFPDVSVVLGCQFWQSNNQYICGTGSTIGCGESGPFNIEYQNITICSRWLEHPNYPNSVVMCAV